MATQSLTELAAQLHCSERHFSRLFREEFGVPLDAVASRAARLKPRVVLNNDASDSATLIEIVAEDRAGLLYDLARAISDAGCDIEVVLIDTEAHKALDVFYVTSKGGKLDDGLQDRLKSSLIDACAPS